ncbi:MAG TPA: hypothetical protein VFI92_09555 [Steroidobacteraceae bacterium]|nr:hypothetical protein [Steroidobacteraceae bacterium]
MAHVRRLEWSISPRVVTGLLSVMLHIGLFFFVVFAGGRQDGVHDDDTRVTQLVMLESHIAEQRDGADLPPLEPPVPAPDLRALLDSAEIRTLPAPLPEDDAEPDDGDSAPAVEIVTPSDAVLAGAVDPTITLAESLSELPTTFVLPQAQAAALLERIERSAQELTTTSHARTTWNQDGKEFVADLVLARAQDGTEFDHVIADISAEDRGRKLRSRVTLKRLPFSHFTQLIDRWDPRVQLHDDEIVGRMHINSRFNVLADAEARPTLLGKVSTAASGFNMEATSRKRKSEVFRGGVETRAGKIPLSQPTHPFEFVPRDAGARIHELAEDTHIRFLADGGYWLRDRKSEKTRYRADPAGQSVYFLAARGATVYVRGVVAGRILVYSPDRIVIEGSVTYAEDPRDVPASRDYLGLVCDRDIVVAPPYVTGPGDLDIHAALFAKRRFVVTQIEHRRPATLRILGSVAAGSVTASEPRYATKVVYDTRFEATRPPGFPSTNRFAADEWDQRWTEAPERSTSNQY